MIFGKIDYINLLPFYIFLKRELRDTQKASLEHKKGVPSKINQDFKNRRVDGAVISSIFSQKYSCTNVGIIAKKEVLSVIVCPGSLKDDIESNTSNILAKILKVEGEVLIGDKALKRYKEDKSCKDLAALWFKKYKLPFVFARLCWTKNKKEYERLSNKFLKQKIKIPQYILKKYSKKTGISKKDIKSYLKLIDYNIDKKAETSLKKFLFLAKRGKK